MLDDAALLLEDLEEYGDWLTRPIGETVAKLWKLAWSGRLRQARRHLVGPPLGQPATRSCAKKARFLLPPSPKWGGTDAAGVRWALSMKAQPRKSLSTLKRRDCPTLDASHPVLPLRGGRKSDAV